MPRLSARKLGYVALGARFPCVLTVTSQGVDMPRNVLLLVLVAVVLLIGLWLLLGASRRRREVAPPDTSEFQRPSEAAGSLPPVPSWDLSLIHI